MLNKLDYHLSFGRSFQVAQILQEDGEVSLSVSSPSFCFCNENTHLVVFSVMKTFLLYYIENI